MYIQKYTKIEKTYMHTYADSERELFVKNRKGRRFFMYKIGEAARLLGLSTEALRYYERKGLIVPHKDSASNYRYFDAS